MSLLFPAQFSTNWFVQFWYGFQGVVAGSMGVVGFWYPNTPAITLGGYWQYLGEQDEYEKIMKEGGKGPNNGKIVLAPNARAWALRNAFAGVVNGLGLYFGTKECYYIMAAVAIWREFFDILEAVWDGDTSKVFYPAKIPPGKFPPMVYFPPWALLMAGNLVTLYMIHTAKSD
jgi:hypothetical protein